MLQMPGRELLARIDRDLVRARQTLAAVEEALAGVSNELAATKRGQASLLRELGALRVDSLEQAALAGALTTAERRACELLDRREQARACLGDEQRAALTALAAAEADRLTAQQAVRDAAAALAAVEARVQRALSIDPDYRRQLQSARAAVGIAAAAERKAQQACADRDARRAAREAEPLFMYLWARRFGTAQYRANRVVRFLHGRVARLCRYQQARADYAMLLEMPERLTEHAARRRAAADAAAQALAVSERAAAEDAGIVPLEQTLDAAESRQCAVDGRIAELEAQVADIDARRAEIAGGEDVDMQAAIALLADAIYRSSPQALPAQARATLLEDDDLLVLQLGDAREAELALERELADARRALRAQQARLRELASLRQRFKRHRYDDLRSRFGDRDALTLLLEQFSAGLLGSDELWRAITRRQRHADVEAWPDFGSGGLPRQRGPWRNPGGGSFRLPVPARGSLRGGGFRTGGGF